jgi:hypothetical protein
MTEVVHASTVNVDFTLEHEPRGSRIPTKKAYRSEDAIHYSRVLDYCQVLRRGKCCCWQSLQ